MADERGDDHQHRRHQQRDLNRRPHGDAHHQSHLVLAREVHRRHVLGGIADHREENDAEEELREAELRRGRLERARDQLGLVAVTAVADGKHASSAFQIGHAACAGAAFPRSPSANAKTSRWVTSV